jgi:hypothetical protein
MNAILQSLRWRKELALSVCRVVALVSGLSGATGWKQCSTMRLPSIMGNWVGLLFVLASLVSPVKAAESVKSAGTSTALAAVFEADASLQGVPFRDVLLAATGKRVLPFNSTNAADRELLAKISSALDRVLAELNQADHAAQKEKRINEVSAHFEDSLRTELNRVPGFVCEVPKTAAGKHQRAGYPDLRLADVASGRVVYLDVKLFETKNRQSTLRTFYFETKQDTNKVLADAHHLLVGFEHAGKVDGHWKFLNWDLVDLSRFNVRLKAEFQGSNRDLYRAEAIVGSSRK